jgi:glycosyltransferase involved in cell wall biosynthesis
LFKISVIIPCYNAERWIWRAITSVLNQTVRPAEILVVDDGSTDSTAEAVRKYGPEVRYFYQQNSGPGAARNLGIRHAESEWIAFLDADDEWLPNKIESQLRILEKNPDLKWCGCAREDVKNGNTTPHPLPESLKEKAMYPGGFSFFEALLEGATFGTPSLVIHRSVFNELGGFNDELLTGEDRDMWCRIALIYPRVGYCCEPCWRYHQDNPDSITQRGRRCHDLQLKSICRNMHRAIELGPQTANEFRPYARIQVMDHLILGAGKVWFFDSNTIKEAKSLFPLTVCERAILRMLKFLPKVVATKAAIKLRP